MAKKRSKIPQTRLFVALDLPTTTRDRIAEWGRRELSDPALRVVPAELLHLTLAFLGHTPEREIDRLGEIVGGLKAAAPTIRLGEPMARPSLRRARLFALPAVSPDIGALQAELTGRLVKGRLYEPEKRDFWPHVTVARIKAPRRGSRGPRWVDKQPGTLPPALLSPIRCVRMTLYRSELNPRGARYTPLAQVELSRGGRQ